METNILALALQMRHAIDLLESAMMGLGDFVELPRVFDGTGDDVEIAPRMTVGQMRQVCTALEDCTRIVNSDEFTDSALASLASTEGQKS